MKTILSLLIFLFLVPQQDSEKILWDENRKLTWGDFQGTPVKGATMVAITNSIVYFSYSYSIENNKVNVEYNLKNFFSIEGSWFIPGKVNPHILSHEQTHFDIAELHTRILRKQLEQKRFSKNVKSELEALYRQMEQQKIVMQKKYDAETEHSRNEKIEIQWQKNIARQLANYDEWK